MKTKDIPQIQSVYTDKAPTLRANNLPDQTKPSGIFNSNPQALQTPDAPKKPKLHYEPALDGLRAIAVLAVIAYHMNLPWAGGGLVGVIIFFVLSGYLITSLLLAEWRTSHTINLKNFWFGRIRRLFPAIIFLILGCAIIFGILDHALLTKLRNDALPAIFSLTNWWYILQDTSYFDALGAPSPLTHFWSLAIEEQFYLIWPILLLALLKLKAKFSWIKNIVLALAVASCAAMALMFDPTPFADPSRAYYGTDTRAFSLLIGVYLALIWPQKAAWRKSKTES